MKETDCRKCWVDDFKNALCEEDFCQKYYREGMAKDFEKLLQQWIPCSERLPDKPNVYIVTDHEGRVVRYVYNDNESSREYWKLCAKAWMPLPKPYERKES